MTLNSYLLFDLALLFIHPQQICSYKQNGTLVDNKLNTDSIDKEKKYDSNENDIEIRKESNKNNALNNSESYQSVTSGNLALPLDACQGLGCDAATFHTGFQLYDEESQLCLAAAKCRNCRSSRFSSIRFLSSNYPDNILIAAGKGSIATGDIKMNSWIPVNVEWDIASNDLSQCKYDAVQAKEFWAKLYETGTVRDYVRFYRRILFEVVVKHRGIEVSMDYTFRFKRLHTLATSYRQSSLTGSHGTRQCTDGEEQITIRNIQNSSDSYFSFIVPWDVQTYNFSIFDNVKFDFACNKGTSCEIGEFEIILRASCTAIEDNEDDQSYDISMISKFDYPLAESVAVAKYGNIV